MADLTVTITHMVYTTVPPPTEPPDPACDYVDTDFLTERFWLCVVIGLTVSIISIVENIFVFILFATSRQHRNSYNLYLLLLAFFDIFMGMSYIALMAVAVLVNFTQSYTLRMMWAHYVVPMLAVSHIAMTTSTYLITFAAIERYAITVVHRSVEVLQKNRRFFVVLAFAIAMLTKGTMFYELTIFQNTNCTGHIQEYAVQAGPLLAYPAYREYFRLHFRTISTVIAPFFILLSLNFRLVLRLMQPAREKNGQMLDVQYVKQKKARIRAATRTLVVLVCTYLVSNVVGVIVSLWEYIDMATLTQKFISFYVLSVDMVSLLTIVSCAARLPIYMIFQPILRKEAIQFIGNMCTRPGKGSRLLRTDSVMEKDAYAATQTLIAPKDQITV